jgi:hypothetical protein
MSARSLVPAADVRRAVVVPSALGCGMARRYTLRRGEGSTRVFVDDDKARRWVETGAGE